MYNASAVVIVPTWGRGAPGQSATWLACTCAHGARHLLSRQPVRDISNGMRLPSSPARPECRRHPFVSGVIHERVGSIADRVADPISSPKHDGPVSLSCTRTHGSSFHVGWSHAHRVLTPNQPWPPRLPLKRQP